MSVRDWIRETLRSQGVPYWTKEHPDVFTAQRLAHEEHMSGHRTAKVVVAYADDRPVMLVLPASHKAALTAVKEMLKAKEVHLAAEDQMRRLFPDCEVGAEPPLPYGKDIEIWMDRSMRVPGDIVFFGGTHRESIRMAFDDWYRTVQPKEADFAIETGRFPPRAMPIS